MYFEIKALVFGSHTTTQSLFFVTVCVCLTLILVYLLWQWALARCGCWLLCANQWCIIDADAHNETLQTLIMTATLCSFYSCCNHVRDRHVCIIFTHAAHMTLKHHAGSVYWVRQWCYSWYTVIIFFELINESTKT